ncbi:MAG: MFS transporter [Methanobacteriota archaeon]
MNPLDRKALLQLLIIEGLVTLAGSLAGVFSVVFLVTQGGASLQSASLFYVEAFAVAVAVVLLSFRLGVKRPRLMMLAGVLLQGCFYLSFVVLEEPALLMVAPIFFGCYIVAFWVPFNILFLEFTSKGNRGEIIGIVFLVFPLVSIFSPILGGFLISRVSYDMVFISALIALLSNAVLIWLWPVTDSKPFEPKLSIEGIGKRLSAGFFFEGGQEGVWFTCNSLLAMLFAKDEFVLGILLGIFALAGGVAVVFIGRISDKKGSRAPYAIGGALASAPFIFLAATTRDTTFYAIAMMALNFTINMMAIFLFTMSSDRMERDMPSQAMTRELLLNAGRVAGGLICALVIFMTGDIRVAFAASAILVACAAMAK